MSDFSQALFHKTATLHSATCFLNALFREWSAYSVVQSGEQVAIRFPLEDQNTLVIPLRKLSVLGRHQYMGVFYLEKGDEREAIDFAGAVALILKTLMRHFNTEASQIEMFKSRVFSSLKNIEHALATRPDFFREFETLGFSFKESEQGLVIGHNFHPTPKSRDGFDELSTLRFSPEFGAQFKLVWLMADPSIVYQKKAESFDDRDWTLELAARDLDFGSDHGIPVPMHPWQFKSLSKTPVIAEYLKSGKLIVLGESKSIWHPTSSLRSVYCEEAPYMLKFSMSVRLTNSIRHLLIHEVDRGLQVRDVLNTELGRRFMTENPSFRIITEPAYLCFKDENQNPLPESIVVCRENPFHIQNSEGKIVLATLTQDGVFGDKNLLQGLITRMDSSEPLESRCRRWFREFLNVAVKPPILAQANYGFVLGAHQQNLILDIKNHLPKAVYFRDCQGTGYSELGYSLFSSQVPSIQRDNGNVLSERMGNGLFCYYLIINSTFNVIAALSASDWISEEELISELRSFLEHLLSEGVRDESGIKYLLNDELLMHKGNFLCSFRNLNENTSADPFSIYIPIKNPICAKTREEAFYA